MGSTTVKFLHEDHLWDCPKVVLKNTFGQSQRWSLIRCTLGVENEEKNSLNFTNKVFNREDVLILSGLNSRISLYCIEVHDACHSIKVHNACYHLEVYGACY